MLHGVKSNECACPPESRLAVDCHCAVLTFSYSEEVLTNAIRRSASVDEKEIRMRNSILCKPLLVVFGFV